MGNGSGTARVAKSLPSKPEIHVVPAGHFTILAPCSPQLVAAVPRICVDDPVDFNRGVARRLERERDRLLPRTSHL